MQFNNLSVVEFNNIIKNIFDSEEMLFNCAVIGEISSFKITNNIAYFTIKDEYAVLSCILFNANKEYKIGEKVKVVGKPNYYVKGGKLNFAVNYITSFGEGEIYKKFLELKEKLKSEGYFYNKKELPSVVKNIGVVTSGKGAVVKDIISVATRRNPNINLYIYPAKVQGNGAEYEISKGIEFFNTYDVDVIIVARGGGSNEDLSVFNTEAVAKSCFTSVKPIISAVGHETDYTLIDLVADIRASTPSVAAEIAVKESKNYLLEIKLLTIKLTNLVKNKIENYKNQIIFLNNETKKIIETKFYKSKTNLARLVNSVKFLTKNKIDNISYLFDNLTYKIKMQNPNLMIDKGYAFIEKGGKKVKSVNDVAINDDIEINLKDGKIIAKVKKVN